eukprot:COSAG05_NODE_11418_length_514_cov_1.293976_1_plen_93_part_10
MACASAEPGDSPELLQPGKSSVVGEAFGLAADAQTRHDQVITGDFLQRPTGRRTHVMRVRLLQPDAFPTSPSGDPFELSQAAYTKYSSILLRP